MGPTHPIPLITSPDLDCLLAGTILLQILGDTPACDILITQGSRLAETLDQAFVSERRYQAVCVTGIGWQPRWRAESTSACATCSIRAA